MSKILPFQNELQGALPEVIGNIEYNNFKALLFRVAEIIAAPLVFGVSSKFLLCG